MNIAFGLLYDFSCNLLICKTGRALAPSSAAVPVKSPSMSSNRLGGRRRARPTKSGLRLRVRPLSILLFFFFAGTMSSVQAEVSTSGLFGHNMVLQQGMPVPVWGFAKPGEKITVTFGDCQADTTTGADGKWMVHLKSLSASSIGANLVVKGENTLTLTNVVVGDVWLCSGQSNMEFGYQNITPKGESVVDPQIRTFCVLRSASLTPLDNTGFIPPEIGLDTQMGHWQMENPGGPWGGFSAVGYFFGKEIRKITKNPVGLIGSYWGGTPAQAWTSLAGLEKETILTNYVDGYRNMKPEQRQKFPVKWADYLVAMKKWDKESREPYEKNKREWEVAARKAKAAGQPEPPQPQMAFPRPANPGNVGTTTSLFNGMINPLIPFAIKGTIWYQGEANTYNGAEYGVLFPAMIRDWRERWGYDFPFLFVQLAGWENGAGRWAALREGQCKALALPNTGMAVAIDVGDRKDIHPKNKLPVVHRLALAAEHIAYGQKVVYQGPAYDSMKKEGNGLRVSFTNIGSGLVIGVPPPMPGQPAAPAPVELKGFEIAGTNRQWFAAKAVIDGATVLVSHDQVAEPVAVRYAWGDYPPCDLYNKEGLPAVPFRTDNWNP